MAKRYFVTGATGAIGSALIPLLLEEPDSQIWLLIRGKSSEHLMKRLEELFDFWEMAEPLALDARKRIFPLLGDTDQNQFALANEPYAKIAQQCTHIIHCAGVVKMNLPLEIARQHALGAAKNIVELALACKQSGNLQKIEYVSTVGVGGKMPGILPETWITKPREFHNTYEQSKAEAEIYLRDQIEQHHLPITVHRPSMVVGDSKTGKIIHHQIFYHICEFLAGRRTYGLLPNLGNAKLDTIPVDYVASVIQWSSLQQDTAGEIFHLCSGPTQSIQLAELQTIVRHMFRSQGFKVPVVIHLPISLFNAVLNFVAPWFSDKLQRAVRAFPFFLDYLADENGFDNSLTNQTYSCHPPSPLDYLATVLTEYRRIQR
ncbi:SDR family oxidoreductase [Methylomonas albis]|uniref:SDR family oxidoreductase n=1 Tax=Methylomonas albis TaxID=1854563 RepID=A0ABR9D3Q0_9GAMM|nr:SDR family oxidoreductase [Methylomonas albis]MBD9357736.1 SDR family oxidoreductase [Methylomonas albis]